MCIKRHYQETERTTHRMGKKIANNILIRAWYPECIKSYYNSTIKRQNFFKWVKDMNRHFSKEDIKISSKHTKDA